MKYESEFTPTFLETIVAWIGLRIRCCSWSRFYKVRNGNLGPVRQSTPLRLRLDIAAMDTTCRAKLTAATQTIKLPKDVVEEIYRTSAKFAGLIETLEILLDKKTLRRIKRGEAQYRRKQYVVAKGPRQIRKVLSA